MTIYDLHNLSAFMHTAGNDSGLDARIRLIAEFDQMPNVPGADGYALAVRLSRAVAQGIDYRCSWDEYEQWMLDIIDQIEQGPPKKHKTTQERL